MPTLLYLIVFPMTRLAKQKVGLSYVGKRYDSSTLKIASAPHQSVSNEYAMARIVTEAGTYPQVQPILSLGRYG